MAGKAREVYKDHLRMKRCPHCGIAKPLLVKVWESDGPFPTHDGLNERLWAAFVCTSCGSVTLGASSYGAPSIDYVARTFPDLPMVDADLPERAQKYLGQAMETLHAPDAAAVMAGSAVDAMLKDKGYTKGSVYSRIEKATEDGVLTADMASWAHNVRLGANRPRHSDDDEPHVSFEEAQQAIEFTQALGQFLFVLTARVARGLEATSS